MRYLQKTEEGKSPAAPWLIGLFVFVVCGSGSYGNMLMKSLLKSEFFQPMSYFSNFAAVFEIIRYVKMGW
jgi:hypothetical protein